jgi:hypothetical protein
MGGESGDVDKYYICTIPGQYYVIMCLRIVDSHGGKHTSVPCTIPRLLYYHNYFLRSKNFHELQKIVISD